MKVTAVQVCNLASGHAGVAATLTVAIPLQPASHRSLEVFASPPSFIARVARILKGILSAIPLFQSQAFFFCISLSSVYSACSVPKGPQKVVSWLKVWL